MSTHSDLRDMTLDQPVPPAEYSNKYASRPLPQTPHSPSRTSSYPYNMSLARALDHDNNGRPNDLSLDAVTTVMSKRISEQSELEAPANVTNRTSIRYSLHLLAVFYTVSQKNDHIFIF